MMPCEDVNQFFSPGRVYAFLFVLFLTRSAAFQQPVPQTDQAANEVKLTAIQQRDSYEIYSLLLRTEMPPQWKIAVWAINQETQTFPTYGHNHSLSECLQFSKTQEPTYQPLIDDYLAKNKKKILLERKFDLPQYALVRETIPWVLPFGASVLFDVSAVGFNPDGTRALVYIGHRCGSLCGGGRYHLLVKRDGAWQIDREYRGMSCMWAS